VLVEEMFLMWAREHSSSPSGNKRDLAGHVKVTSARVSLLITPKELLGRCKWKEHDSQQEFPPLPPELLF